MGIIRLLGQYFNNKNSYDKNKKDESIKDSYEQEFIKTMHRHNEKLLNYLVPMLENKKEQNLRILDVSGMNGDNISFLLKKNIEVEYTLLERSEERINLAKARLGEGITYVQGCISDFLENCSEDSYDVVICTGAFRYIDLKSFMKECKRIVKPKGKVAILIGLKDSMSEIKQIFYKLLIGHSRKIKKIIVGDPDPASKKEIEKICHRNHFKKIVNKEARQVFGFASPKRLVKWLLSTGIFIRYEEMLDLKDQQVKTSFIELIEEEQIGWVTHNFVYGIWEKN